MPRIYGPGPAAPPPLVSTGDLAGLSTRDVEGSPVGELVGALSDQQTGLIRYLDVSIQGADKHVLVPIGHARIERSQVPPRVRLRAATHEDLLSVPAYLPGETEMDSDYQDRVMEVHGRLFYGSRYYAHPAYDHASLRAGDTPVVSTTAPAEEGRLSSLSETEGLRLTRGTPQVVGWSVVDEGGERVGTVEDLLVDRGARSIRYVVIELEAPHATSRLATLPIGYVEMDQEDERVVTPALTEEDIRLLPPFEPPLTREEENRLHAALEGRLSGERYFDRPDFRQSG